VVTGSILPLKDFSFNIAFEKYILEPSIFEDLGRYNNPNPIIRLE
jgi:hypothetical protein